MNELPIRAAEQFPLVSVVTPVHNGAPFLHQCVESVIRQTYPHWEYVIVNNASTDDSATIAERYAAQDGRIRVVHTPAPLPKVDSHNFALRQISPASAYCKVVHADDWLFPECLARMVEVAEAHSTVGIVSAYRLVEDVVTLDGLPVTAACFPGKEIGRRSLLGELYVFGSPTSLLLRSEIVRARFEFYADRAPWTDVDVCYEILKRWDFGFVHQVLTFTRRHDASGTADTARFGAPILGRLALLRRHGRDFLTEAERRQRTREVLAQYRRFLLRSFLTGREKAFWEYHARGLASAGYPARLHLLVLREAGAVLMDLLRSPISMAGRILALTRTPDSRRSSAVPRS
ncbi:MAG: glycosyltransferase family 2 protein [Armatimonadota bacterium]|nr:glycosyltransferase family 2 protein [Armatimonadota bacterium]MDR7573533.1 glycosyltransferase family 2 protein [Armatimonadota bacterium]